MVNGFLLYWVRFLNIFLAAGLVWLTYAAARLLFPDRSFVRIGAPLLMAVLPQDTFYSIQSDVLSPLCYAAAFICLVRWCRDEQPSSGLSAGTGLSLAATSLVKTSNLPLLVVALIAIVVRVTTLARFGKLRSALPGLGVLGVCAVGPLAGWCLWCLHVSGDLTGSTAKVRALGWTWKTAADWWSHPIFTPHGAWRFWSGLMATFWRGEFTWHGFGHPLASPLADVFYSVSSLFLCGLAAGCLVHYDRRGNPRLYRELGLGLAGFVAGAGFLAVLSVVFDFGNCPFPSRTYPYMTSGRLISGSLVPFLLLYVYGLDYAFRWCKSEWPRWFGLGLSATVAIASEILVSLPVFSSQYNWYHF
jgi:hypothetical protein